MEFESTTAQSIEAYQWVFAEEGRTHLGARTYEKEEKFFLNPERYAVCRYALYV